MDPGPLAPVLESLLQDLKTGVKEKRSLLQNRWLEIVGRAFSKRTKPSWGKGGVLVVWVKDSALAYEMSQRYRGTITKRAENILGEGTVKRIIFRVGELR